MVPFAAALLPLLFLKDLVAAVGDGLIDEADQQLFLQAEAAGELLDVPGALQGVIDEGQGGDAGADGFAAGGHVVSGLLEEEVRLEEQEIAALLGQVLLEDGGTYGLEVAVGIFAVGQDDDTDVEAGEQEDVDAAQGCFDAGLIPVVEQGDVLGLALDQGGLARCQARPGRCYDVLNAVLVQADYVGIALHHVDVVELADRLPGLVDAVKDVRLMVDLALGAVDVLGGLDVLLEDAAGEGDRLALQVMDGEHDAVPEEIASVTDQPQLLQLFFFVAGSGGGLQEPIPFEGGEAEAELVHDLLAEAPAFEIAQADGLTDFRPVKLLLKVLLGELIDEDEGLALLTLFADLLAHLLLFEFQVVLGGQAADGVGEGQLLQRHEKLHRVTALAAAEALVDVAGGVDVEGRRLLVVEGAQADHVLAAAAQIDVIPHDVLDAGGINNFSNGLLGDHRRSKIRRGGCRNRVVSAGCLRG